MPLIRGHLHLPIGYKLAQASADKLTDQSPWNSPHPEDPHYIPRKKEVYVRQCNGCHVRDMDISDYQLNSFYLCLFECLQVFRKTPTSPYFMVCRIKPLCANTWNE